VSRLSKSNTEESEDPLLGLWDENNRRASIQIQNITLQWFRKTTHLDLKEQEGQIEDLQQQIHDLEKLVIQSQQREEETWKQLMDAHRAPVMSTQDPSMVHGHAKVKESRVPTESDVNTKPKIKPSENTQFQRVSSVLPAECLVK